MNMKKNFSCLILNLKTLKINLRNLLNEFKNDYTDHFIKVLITAER